MADNKKYYYIKLKENFFDDDTIKILEGMPDGYLYSNILLKLYLRSLRGDGKLMLNDMIPYSQNMISQVTGHPVGVVEKALEIFKQLGLIDVLDDGTIFMMNLQNFIGKSSTEADRKRDQRKMIETNKSLSTCRQSGDNCLPYNGQNIIECPTDSGQMSQMENITNCVSELQPLENAEIHLNGQMSDKCSRERELERELELENRERERVREREKTGHHPPTRIFGYFKNIPLSEVDYKYICERYEKPKEVIEKTSRVISASSKTYSNPMALLMKIGDEDFKRKKPMPKSATEEVESEEEFLERKRRELGLKTIGETTKYLDNQRKKLTDKANGVAKGIGGNDGDEK